MPGRIILFLLIFACIRAPAWAAEIALVQYDADQHFADYSHNREALTNFAREAAQHGSQLVVFPEGSLYGYATPERHWCHQPAFDPECRDVNEVAEAVPGGQSTQYWETFSKTFNVYIVFNLPERDGSSYFNTSVVVGPHGYVTKYRKRSLYHVDTHYASPGNLGPVSFATPFGRFGMLICMDVNEQSFLREYRQQGITNVLVQMDWDEDPNGLHGARPARLFFQQLARRSGLNLYASDVSPWDGTGAYLHSLAARERHGLSPIAIGQDGISYHQVVMPFSGAAFR